MAESTVQQKKSLFAHHWLLDTSTDYLNHGSFGACPIPVLEFQRNMSLRLENSPWRFQVIELAELQRANRQALAVFVNADVDDLVFVPNVTHGVSTVLRSLQLKSGDELLTTNQDYFACHNALEFIAARAGAKVVSVKIPFPLQSSQQIIETILAGISQRTRVVMIDHVTSPTGIVLPIEKIVHELSRCDIDVLVDGAHAPGMVPVDLRALGATFYTGNCHKWICAPKGAGFLYVRRERQNEIHPLAISHVATEEHRFTSDFQHEFFWAGTIDQAPYISVAEAIRFMGSLLPGGWDELMVRNRQLAIDARRHICEALAIAIPCPDEMIGSLAAIPIPDAQDYSQPVPAYYIDPLQERLFHEFRIDVPVFFWPQPPKRILRISAQIYNDLSQFERLASALRTLSYWN